MRTYGELFRAPEFTPLFAAASAQAAGGTISGLALGSLVYASTGSPLLSALSLFGSSFAQVIGATALLSLADRLPPRALLTTIATIFAAGTVAMAIPGMPIWGLFAVITALGLTGSVGGGVRWGLLSEILPDEGYLLGRSVFNMAVGATQIGGFALGGILVAALSPRETLLAAAGLDLLAAVVVRAGLTRRAPRATGRPSARETWRVNALLWSSPARRHLYLALWIPNGLIVGCEALFIPYAPDAAGVLFMAGALGMLAGDTVTVTGRFVPHAWRSRLITPMRLLLAVPYLLFALPLPFPVAVTAVAAASAGFGAGLLLQDRLVALIPDGTRGQALGLHSAGMLTMQAVSASIAGLVAQYVPPATAIALMACASLAVTIALTPGLREPAAPSPAEAVPRPPSRRSP